MIRYLNIERLAVIDQLEIEFGPGLSVLTGETGAGKSILVEAVGLLLGERASADLVRTGAETANIQAVLETVDGRELLVRREVSAQGRSRAFIDGALATTAALRDAVSDLVDLHGQHEHQSLLQPQTQLALLDRFAELDEPRAHVAALHADLLAARQALADAELTDRDRAARLDLLDFQRHEIDKVKPRSGEDATLEVERRVASNADKLSRLCNESYASLYDDDGAVLSRLGQVWKRVAELSELDPRFAPFLEAREGVRSQLEELAFCLRDFATSIEGAGDKLQSIEDRLAQLDRLKHRFGPTLDEVIARRAAIDGELTALGNSVERLAELRSEQTARRLEYIAAATRLSNARRAVADRFATRLAESLGELAMPGSRCELRFDSTEADETRWSATGFDRLELLLSPNPGEDVRPMARIASGGELSRVMLAIKTLASTDDPGKTLIFDEVDAGIGGRVATVVGERLRALAAQCQVLCITHLPQVAAAGHAHYLVAKHLVSDRTVTQVEPLTGSRRVEEIARMMGGREITAKVLAGAKDSHGKPSFSGWRKAKGESESGRRLSETASGKGTYFVETFGCQMNVHDSERMAGLLEADGYTPAPDARDADVVVINTCSVREKAEEKLFTRLGEIRVDSQERGRRPIVAVAGCVAQQEGRDILRRSKQVDVIVGTQAVTQLPTLVARAERGSRGALIDLDPHEDVSFPFGLTRRDDPVRAYVTIIEGCNEFCAFCVVPYTRGHERMRPVAEILAEVRHAAATGRREVQLLGQIVNHYRAPDRDDCDFARLLELVSEVDGIDRIRFASPHPRHFTRRVIDAVCSLPKVCRHFHMPVQSGSASILRAMRRRYTPESYIALTQEIRDALPGVALSTDMIVGFPGETDADFEDTLSLVRTVRFHSMFSFKYSPRPKTLAGKRMPDDVPEPEKTRRIVALQQAQKDIQAELFADAVGHSFEVLVDGISRRRATELTGRTSGNTIVNFAGEAGLIGRLVQVRITEASPNSLRGELASASPVAAQQGPSRKSEAGSHR